MNDALLRSQIIRLAHSDPALRPHLLPLLREGSTDKAARLQARQEQILRKYLDSAATSGTRAATGWDELPDRVRADLRRVKDQETLWMDVDRWFNDNAPAQRSRWAAEKTAHGPVALKYPAVMLYMIDPEANASKFYEMAIVMTGDESDAKKNKTWGRASQYVLMRRWGRLTDSGATGRIDSMNDYFDDKGTAERMMASIKTEKTRKGYRDVTRAKEYPIGLGGAGFGWGGQAACEYIPELQQLHGEVETSLSNISRLREAVAALARRDSSMGRKLGELLGSVVTEMQAMDAYLESQLTHCRG